MNVDEARVSYEAAERAVGDAVRALDVAERRLAAAAEARSRAWRSATQQRCEALRSFVELLCLRTFFNTMGPAKDTEDTKAGVRNFPEPRTQSPSGILRPCSSQRSRLPPGVGSLEVTMGKRSFAGRKRSDFEVRVPRAPVGL